MSDLRRCWCAVNIACVRMRDARLSARGKKRDARANQIRMEREEKKTRRRPPKDSSPPVQRLAVARRPPQKRETRTFFRIAAASAVLYHFFRTQVGPATNTHARARAMEKRLKRNRVEDEEIERIEVASKYYILREEHRALLQQFMPNRGMRRRLRKRKFRTLCAKQFPSIVKLFQDSIAVPRIRCKLLCSELPRIIEVINDPPIAPFDAWHEMADLVHATLRAICGIETENTQLQNRPMQHLALPNDMWICIARSNPHLVPILTLVSKQLCSCMGDLQIQRNLNRRSVLCK